MKLTLDRLDLRPEFENINCSRTRFEHFREEVQKAILIVGDAMFWEYDESNYNRILIPQVDQTTQKETQPMSQNNQPYTPVFDWAIVELFGHQRIIGQIGEQQIGGETFIRVDVPQVGETPAFTKLYGKGAIYAMTPVTESLAKEALEAMKPVPVNPYDLNLHRLPARSQVIEDAFESDDDFYPEDDED